MAEHIEREATCEDCVHYGVCYHIEHYGREIETNEPCKSFINAADVVEVNKVAEMLSLSFGDDCACNFNGNDEWLWEKCKYAETDCPYPKDEFGCWKEFVKHFLSKMDRN